MMKNLVINKMDKLKMFEKYYLKCHKDAYYCCSDCADWNWLYRVRSKYVSLYIETWMESKHIDFPKLQWHTNWSARNIQYGVIDDCQNILERTFITTAFPKCNGQTRGLQPTLFRFRNIVKQKKHWLQIASRNLKKKILPELSLIVVSYI